MDYIEIPIYFGRWKDRRIRAYLKISPQDFDLLNQYSITLNGSGYPIIKKRINNKQVTIWVHRLIMNPSDDMFVDHINHDKLDATRDNLRIVTARDNNSNLKLSKVNTSGYRGVHPLPTGKFQGVVHLFKKTINCGVYLDIKDAAQAAANKRRELGMLDEGKLPEYIPVEHKRLKKIYPNASPVPGINWLEKEQKWKCRLYYKSVNYYIGLFDTFEEAVQAQNRKKIELQIDIEIIAD